MIHLQLHNQATDFLAVTQSILEEDEVSNGLMLGLALRLQEHPERVPDDLFLATVQDGEQLIAAALMTPPNNLIVFSRQTDPSAAFDLLANRLRTWPQRPPGVNGRKEWSQHFAQRWQALTGQYYRVAVELRVFRLDEVVYGLGAAPGAMRVATMSDLELATQWMDDFAQEALPHETARNSAQQAVAWRIEQESLFLWEEAGEVVSMAGKSRPTAHGISIGPVYTPPKLRGRGYATAMVATLSQHLLDSGYTFTTLFTDLANPTSNRIYQKIGYQPVCDFTEYLFEASYTNEHN